MKTRSSGLAGLLLASLLGATAMAADTATSTTTTTTATTAVPSASISSAAGDSVGISSQDGISLSGTDVIVTRNGVTQAVTKEMVLENGYRISPDGSVLISAGNRVMLRPGQIMLFNGQIVETERRASSAVVPVKE